MFKHESKLKDGSAFCNVSNRAHRYSQFIIKVVGSFVTLAIDTPWKTHRESERHTVKATKSTRIRCGSERRSVAIHSSDCNRSTGTLLYRSLQSKSLLQRPLTHSRGQSQGYANWDSAYLVNGDRYDKYCYRQNIGSRLLVVDCWFYIWPWPILKVKIKVMQILV